MSASAWPCCGASTRTTDGGSTTSPSATSPRSNERLRAKGFLTRWLDRVWPAASPDELVRALLTSRERLAAAAAGILTPDEQRLLLRPRAAFAWSDGDVPLLDEARALLDEPPRRLRPRDRGRGAGSDARCSCGWSRGARAAARSPCSATSRRPQARCRTRAGPRCWRSFPDGEAAEVEELRHAYRVPAEIMELALPLLARIAPAAQPPIAFRTGGEPPRVRRVAEGALVAEALREAAALAREDGLLAVILPDQLVPEFESASAYDDGIPAALATRREGARVRPRRRGRAGADRCGRAGTARALRRPDPSDADAGRRARSAAARSDRVAHECRP